MSRGTGQREAKLQGSVSLNSELPGANTPLISGEHLHFFCGRRPSGEIPFHRHEHLEISLLFEPAVCSVSWGMAPGTTVTKLNGPAILLVAPQAWHACRWECEADVMVIHLERPLQRELRFSRKACAPALPLSANDQVIWEIASGLRRLCLANDPVETRALALTAKTVACRAIELLGKPAPESIPPAGLLEAEFQQVEQFMRTHIAHDIGVIDLARCVGYSPQHFNALFKARTGISAPVFLMQLRMAKAKELFSAGARTIKSVAEAVGYFDAGNFTAKFRDYFGISPRHLIAQIRVKSAIRPSISEIRP
jgi:AraC-like DNA-binding protein